MWPHEIRTDLLPINHNPSNTFPIINPRDDHLIDNARMKDPRVAEPLPRTQSACVTRPICLVSRSEKKPPCMHLCVLCVGLHPDAHMAGFQEPLAVLCPTRPLETELIVTVPSAK